MLSKKLKVEMIARALMISIILFNALMPTIALAKSSATQNDLVTSLKNSSEEKLNKPDFLASIENNPQQRYVRPISQANEKLDQSENAILQTGTALLQCDPSSSTQPWGSPICSSTNPSISLTETFEKDEGISNFAGGDVRFKIQC